MSLPWAALLKRLSIRLQPHGPSHLIRSQWKPVAPCHHSYSIGKRCNGGSHWSTELDTLRKPFRRKERILCDSCTTPSHMGGAALGWRGEIAWGRGMLVKKGVLFLYGLHSEPKASSKILSIKLPTYSFKLHLNENEDHYSTSKLKSLLSLWLCLHLSLCFPLSLRLSFISHLPPLVFTCQWLLCKCLSSSLFFFVPPIYMSAAFAAWWCCVAMKVICSVTVRPFYQLLLSSILVSEYWWQWNQGAVKTFCKRSC